MWKPTVTSDDVLMHSAKGTRWANHKYTDIVNGRYIYPESTKSSAPAYNQGINSRKGKAANQPKKKGKLSRSQYHQHGGTSGTVPKRGSSGEFEVKSSARNKGRLEYEKEKKQLAADAAARAEKNKMRYENAKINAARAAGEKQRREANEKASKLKKLKQQKVRYARDKGRKQVAALNKPTLIDHARNFLHEGSIKYNRFVRGLSEMFDGNKKKKKRKK